jgi:putative acyl-CoA dehydrogenase
MTDFAFTVPDDITHEVTNQVPPMAGHDAYAADLPLREAVAREGAVWAEADLHALGREAMRPDVQAWAHEANMHPPVLHTHDRYGNRVDLVEFHPSYHALMRLAFGAGVHAYAWNNPRTGAHIARAALSYLWNQAENGVG